MQCVFDGKDVLYGFLRDLENMSVVRVFPLMFHEKLDKNNSLVFIVSPLVSFMVDQVRCLCVSECPYALLKDVHS